jgi:L-threonylcarbamoyladenylate synthase
VAAPSANRSGRPSPTRAWHVELDLDGLIPYIIEAGNCEYGLESTVVDVTGDVPVILRPGAISAAAIREVAGKIGANFAEKSGDAARAPRSPGMKYRHYAPRASVLIISGPELPDRILLAQRQTAAVLAAGRRVGVFACRRLLDGLALPVTILEQGDGRAEIPAADSPVVGIAYGEMPDSSAAAAALFDALRRLDQAGVAVIIAEGLPEHGIGAAYMNRLYKAAGAGKTGHQPEPAGGVSHG